MSEQEALAKLRDIHLPDPIHFWPLASGWYLLVVFILLGIGFLFYYVHRFYRYSYPKREALKLLERYEKEYQNLANSQKSSMQVSELLKRVALVYYPRKEVAGLKEEAWLAFLSSTSKGIDCQDLREFLLVLPYQPAKEINLTPLFSQARRWIKQRGKPCLN